MSSRDQQEGDSLSPLDAALLVLFAGQREEGASPYEVERLIRDGVGGVLGYSPSQVYKRVKVLAEDQLLEASVVPRRSRSATLYRVTQTGLDAARRWLKTPARVPPIGDSEAFIRIRGGRFAQPAVVLEGLAPLRWELEDRLQDLRDAQRRVRRAGPWDHYTALEFDLHRSLILAYLGWLDRVEDELADVPPSARGA